MFRHPSYYKKLRASQVKKSDQAISGAEATAEVERSPGPGHKRQATSSQAASDKLQAPSDSNNRPQASSSKHKGSSFKPQASSAKIPDPGKSFTVPEPRCSTKINVLRGCLI